MPKEYVIIKGTSEFVQNKINELYAEELGSKGKTQIIPLGFGVIPVSQWVEDDDISPEIEKIQETDGIVFQALIIARVDLAPMGYPSFPQK